MFALLRGESGRPDTPAGPVRAVITCLIVIIMATQGGLRSAAAEVVANTYHNADYPVSISWDDDWFLVSEEPDPSFDTITISDGLTYCTIMSGPDPEISPEGFIASLVGGLRNDPSVTDFDTMRDADGNAIRTSDGERASAAFTYTFTSPDGEAYLLARYIEVWIVPGVAYAAFMAEVLASNYESETPAFQKALAALTIGPTPAARGEPAPVFVAGPWRLAIASAASNESFPDLGLKPKTGKRWLVAILDVTNWSDQDAVLSARDFTIQSGASQKPAKIARSSVPRLADKLETTPFAEDLTLAIAGGETARVTLAFVIPADAESVALDYSGNALPLDEVLTSLLKLGELPANAVPPEVKQGVLVSAADGQTVRVQYEGEARSTRLRLLGVNPPFESSCFAGDAEAYLDDLAGAAVFVEEDAAISSGSPPNVYLWLVNEDGTRVLLNQVLIANGAVTAVSLPADARFSAWFDATAKAADLANTGLWAGCATTRSNLPTGDATPAASPVDR